MCAMMQKLRVNSIAMRSGTMRVRRYRVNWLRYCHYERVEEPLNVDNWRYVEFARHYNLLCQRCLFQKDDRGADDARSRFVICSGGLYPNAFRVQTVDFENAEAAKSDHFTMA